MTESKFSPNKGKHRRYSEVKEILSFVVICWKIKKKKIFKEIKKVNVLKK